MNAQSEPLTLRLRRPLLATHGETITRRLLILRIEADDGVVGFGEAAPLEPYDGVSFERCSAALERHVAVLRDGAGLKGGALLDACRAADPLPQALAAVDLALWDAAGHRESRPVASLIADELLLEVPVNATIGAQDRASAAAAARAAVEAGFSCVKLKVGIGDDAGRVAAVRAALGPGPALRLDANGAWTVDEAIAAIAALAPAGLELVEEPVHGTAALRKVRESVDTRVAMDETAAELGALASGAADAVCLKVSRAGGIGGLLAQAALVRTTGAEAYLASTLDGPLGIAAAIHCAAALRVGLPCGLATLDLFDSVDPAGLRARDGSISVPDGPGLGVEPPG